jgi:cyclase
MKINLAFWLLVVFPVLAFGRQEIEVLPVQGNVYLLVGSSGNIALQIGDEGTLFVDTDVALLSDKVLAKVRGMSQQPIRYIVNTSGDGDHVGGNIAIGKAGSTRIGGNVVGNIGASASQTKVVAHDNVLKRMAAQTTAPQDAWPTDTYFTGQKELFFNGEGIQIIHQPTAHTDGDSIVYFRKSDVIAAGDIFDMTRYPVIDLEHGGSVTGIISGLNHILDIAIPRAMQEGGTMVIPGHGRIGDEHDVLEYRDMVVIIRDRIQAMIRKGASLDQIKTSSVTLDYDARYGSGAMFVEAIYRNLR